MRLRSLQLTLIVLAVMPLVVHGQQQPRIQGDFMGMRFEAFVEKIEKETGYHFFYSPAWTDSLVVNLRSDGQPLEALLNGLFSTTNLHYAIAGDAVYITQDREIMTELAPGLFPAAARDVTRKPTGFNYSAYEGREKAKQLAEARLYSIGNRADDGKGNATLAGNIRDDATGEPVIGAAVFIEHPVTGVTTDQFGYYALTIPKGRHAVHVKSVGMKSTQRQVMLHSNGRLDIELLQDITPLKEVVVQSEQDAHVMKLQMGMEKLDIKTMKQLPLVLGETDIMKVVLTLPGVQSVGEGTVGLNVRGGATNQNLILFNDAVVYNPSHLFGFFSTFNPDVLKNVELYKSGITAEYGGRLSSVLDVHTREGNAKKLSGSGGISPVTGRFTVEGPIINDKTTFIVGARSTYSNWLLRQLDDDDLKNSKASFYDITASLTHTLNENNSFYLSGYFSKDYFKLNSDTAYHYSDRNASFKWKHIFTHKLYGVLTAAYSRYGYSIDSDKNKVNAFTMDFGIRQLNARADFNYFPSSRHTITAGVSTTRYDLSPGNLQPDGNESLILPDVVQDEQGLESAVYAGENFEVTEKLSVYAGIRYSFYQYLGAKDVFQYSPGGPRETSTITDTLHYSRGKAIARYSGAEPRFSARYAFSANTSVKLSYNRMRQYIQMLSNTTAITPTDTWKLSDTYLTPQYGDQFSLGLYRNLNLKNSLIELSLETYYKITQRTLDYKNGAVLLLNHHLETDILAARGKAYGVELMIKKAAGKFNGWISYTYSRSFLKTLGTYSSEVVNGGKYYPSNFDKPHAVNVISNYKFSRRFNFSLNLVYSTGRPITLPIVRYEVDGTSRVYYSDRNQFRIPYYFRSDISINVEGNHKVRKLAHSSWTFAVYNLTSRANAYSVFFVSQNGEIKGYKLSVFARAIPTVTYNFKF